MSTRNHTLSQHFLRSPRLAHVLIGHSNLKRRDLVLDIGAGSGVITLALAKRCREVWAIESDSVAVSKLQVNLKKYQIINVRVFQQDFLNLKLPEEPYKIFANPPFHLSSVIFNKLLDAPLPPEAIYLILQKQLALKLINTDRHYNSQLGLRINQSYQTKIRLPLRPSDFTPPPAVPTVLYQAKQIKSLILNN